MHGLLNVLSGVWVHFLHIVTFLFVFFGGLIVFVVVVLIILASTGYIINISFATSYVFSDSYLDSLVG
jgi:hypothetical protein